MSDTQTAWAMLWDHACKADGPFEIEEVVPALATKLGKPEEEARRLITFLLGEMERMPDGREFFALEGKAVVPLPEFSAACACGEKPLEAYPYEL